MPDISEIVNISIVVQSSALSRKGFNSLMITGAAANFDVGFVEHEVREYTTYQAVVDDTDILSGDVKDMAQVAFAQTPAIPKLYISRINTTVTSTDLDAIAANNNDWFGYAHAFATDADQTNASSWLAANKKYGFFLITDKTKDLALASNYSSIWYTDATYTSTAKWLQVAIASRILAKIPGSYTAAFKTLELVSTTQLTGTEETVLRTNNVNQYSQVSGRSITWNGKTSNGGFIDTYIGALYLEARMAEDLFAQLASVEKIPYTNAGVGLLLSAGQARLNQSVIDGYLTDDPAPVITAPLVADISAVNKSNRLLPDITFTAYTAGAVHTVQISGTIVA